MCGILGAVNVTLGQRELDLIRHRGPDAGGLVSVTSCGKTVTLAHRRLSILDLSPTGAQPMSSPDGRYVLSFNGEVYNHADLRREMPGQAFAGHSDTETVLHALARWGAAALPRFNGIFALAFLDAVEGRLLLARDPFGVKPLYHVSTGDGLLFSSEIRPLLALRPDTLDRQRLAQLLRLRFIPSPGTLWTDTRKTRPAHYIEVDLSLPRISPVERPFAPPVPPRQDIPLSDAVARFGRLMEAAVARQLMSDVEVGVLLSGGLDSALVAALAARHLGYRPKAFTVGFDRPSAADETGDAARTAALLGLDHHVVRIGLDDFLDAVRRCVDAVEEPVATTSVVPMDHLSRLAASHVKVVLSGQGADEPLGGYGRYRGLLLGSLVPRRAAAPAASLARAAGLSGRRLERALTTWAAPTRLDRFLGAYTVFSPEEIRRLTGVEDTLSAPAVASVLEGSGIDSIPDDAAAMMSADLRLDLADDLLLYTDKITMQHSLECRVPMLDLPLVEFAESLPRRHRIGFLQGKLLLRRFAESILPGEILRRPKKGFESPTREWFHDRRVADLLTSPGTRFSSVVDGRAVASILRLGSKGPVRERETMLLLNLYFWLERNGWSSVEVKHVVRG